VKKGCTEGCGMKIKYLLMKSSVYFKCTLLYMISMYSTVYVSSHE
jgi:hypothetical protein